MWDKASATSRPCHMAVALVEGCTEIGWRATFLARSESDGQPHKLTPKALGEF